MFLFQIVIVLCDMDVYICISTRTVLWDHIYSNSNKQWGKLNKEGTRFTKSRWAVQWMGLTETSLLRCSLYKVACRWYKAMGFVLSSPLSEIGTSLLWSTYTVFARRGAGAGLLKLPYTHSPFTHHVTASTLVQQEGVSKYMREETWTTGHWAKH